MRRSVHYAVLLVALTLALPAVADKAKSLYNKGRDAEASQKYEDAYDFFRQAYALKPKEVRYRVSYERTRFLAAAAHVHQGQILRDGGKLQEAVDEFQKAADIDPSSFIARQELRRTQDMLNGAAVPASAIPPDEIQSKLQDAQGPAVLAQIAPTPITFVSSEEARMIFQTIGQIAGVNVLFDSDYTSKRISVKLNNVTLDDALDIVALESRSFWRPVTANTIFVANDTPTKRNELQQQVMKTFYLSNLSQPSELQDIQNVFRTVLELTRISPVQSQNAIVVRGTPDQVALAEKIIDDIDQSRPEVVVDIAIMQVSRDKIRDLGITPPASASVQLQSNVSSSSSTTTGTTATGTSTTTTPNISLNNLANLNATNFQVTVPQATANFLLSDTNTKIIQNPQIRASDGQKASLKIGERIPVATGSFQPGIGGVGINPLVNTQFQYQDVGVNIEITPHVHPATREVTLKITLEVSSVTAQSNIGGISQPVIGQRKIDHEIRLKEGEVNLLGGILEDTTSKALSGIPGLAQIPLLKYLFSDTHTEHHENEIVFALVPHIVRGQDLTAMNLRAIDVGMGSTGGSVQLRHRATPSAPAPATSPVPGGGASNSPATAQPQTSLSAVPPMQPPTSTPDAAAPGAGALAFDPAVATATAGSTFAVNIVARNATDVSSVPMQVTYDAAKLQLVNVSTGSFLSRDGQVVVLTHREDESTGTAQMTASRPSSAPGVSGDGPVFTLTFLAKTAGQSSLVISRTAAKNAAGQPVPLAGSQATVNVR